MRIPSLQSLKEIEKKVNNGTYSNTNVFAADVHLMLDNAMTYVSASVRFVSDWCSPPDRPDVRSPAEPGRQRELHPSDSRRSWR